MNPHRQAELILKICVIVAPAALVAAAVAHLMGWDR
jgi:hypothetical protein